MEKHGHFTSLSNKRLRRFAIILIILIVLFVLFSHLLSSKNNPAKQPSLVVLAPTQRHDVPVYLLALGSVTPTSIIAVKTQINGRLMQVLFKEGQIVKAGDLLATIDPRSNQALLAQYNGQLARDQALLANAQLDLKRYQTLWEQDSVAEQILATQRSLVKQYQGAIALDQGLIESVKVNLDYCRITSPVDGRVGLRLVDAGNIVQTTDPNGIAVINTINPITVIFSIPEDDVPKVTKPLFSGKTLTVLAYDRTQTDLLATGKLLTIDNQIDPSTGTVKLRAQFENKEHTLFPNQFVNIKLLVNTLHQALVIPTAAIQYRATGPFVYTIDKAQKAHVTAVTVGMTFGEGTVVTQGLAFGEHVVVQGADKLVDGVSVSVAEPTTLPTKATVGQGALHPAAL